MYNICCIGHITQDKVVNPQITKFMPGGTAWYFCCALSRLNVRTALVTSLAETEMHYAAELIKKGIQVNVHPSRHTVYFENIYGHNHDERIQNVLQTADQFTVEQMQGVEAKIFHLGPLLANDIPLDVVKHLAQKGIISIDVQGYLRKLSGQNVYAAEWPEKVAILRYADIVKADIGELHALTAMSDARKGAMLLAEWGVKEVVVTNGSKGSFIYYDGVYTDIAAYTPSHTVDATGCGDTYMAGYLYKRVKGADVEEAGNFAAAMSGLKTSASGAFEGTADDVEAFKSTFKD